MRSDCTNLYQRSTDTCNGTSRVAIYNMCPGKGGVLFLQPRSRAWMSAVVNACVLHVRMCFCQSGERR